MTTAARCQQEEVYAAHGVLPQGREFASLDDAQAWLDGLRETWYWAAHLWRGPARVEVGPARSRTRSVGWYDRDKDAGRIELAPPGRCEKTIVHELAHVFADALDGSTAHDPAFCRWHLILVYCVFGSDAYTALFESYVAHGVEFRA